MKINWIIGSLLLTATTVHGETLKGGHPACVSEDLYDQLSTAGANDDKRGFEYLIGNGCIVTKGGIQVSVLDKSWTGVAKVRAYVGDKAIVLWTSIENIED